jgi:hypothetical protein
MRADNALNSSCEAARPRSESMAYQIGLFCMPQLADAECPKADQIGGYTCACSTQTNYAS